MPGIPLAGQVDPGAAMRRAAVSLAMLTDLDAVEAHIVHLLEIVLGGHGIAFCETGSEGHADVLALTVPGTQGVSSHRRLPITAHHPLIETLRDGSSRMFQSFDELIVEYPELAARARASGDGAWAHVALNHEGRIMGAVGLAFREPRPFSPEDVELYEEFSYVSLAAIRRARLYSEQAAGRERVELSSSLMSAAVSVNKAANPREVLEMLVERAERMIRSGAVAFASYWRDEDPEPAAVVAGPMQPAPSSDQVRWTRRRLRGRSETSMITGARLAEAPGHWRDREGIALVPIEVSGRRIGALVVLMDEAQATSEDLNLFAALAAICGQAFERTRLQEREHQMANVLQEMFLDSDMPSLPMADVAARYQPSSRALAIGGDWYQVLPLDDDLIGLAVGDVVGRGLSAASAMGQIRSALAGAAVSSPSPESVLAALDSVSRFVPGGLYTTVAYCLLEPVTGVLRYACAGHPPPLLLDESGGVRLLEEGRGAPLGTSLPRISGEGIEVLSPGDSVILYSDGLFERREEDVVSGLERLMDVVSSAYALGPAEGAELLLEQMLGSDRSVPDDVTLLWLTLKNARIGSARPYDDAQQLT